MEEVIKIEKNVEDLISDLTLEDSIEMLTCKKISFCVNDVIVKWKKQEEEILRIIMKAINDKGEDLEEEKGHNLQENNEKKAKL